MSYITDSQAKTVAAALQEHFTLPSDDLMDWDDDIKDALIAQVMQAQKDGGNEIFGEATCDLPEASYALLFTDPQAFIKQAKNAVYLYLESDLREQMTQAIAANVIRENQERKDAALTEKHESRDAA